MRFDSERSEVLSQQVSVITAVLKTIINVNLSENPI